jgi:serine/threonine-protein kinase RsbW
MSSPPLATVGSSADADAEAADVVELRLPAAPRYLRLARLTAAGLAGDLGFDMESLEDLRVAVDELCAAIIEGVEDSSTLELRYQPRGRGIRIDGQIVAPGDPVQLHPVAEELLRMVADSYDVASTDGRRAFWVSKEPAAVEPERS